MRKCFLVSLLLLIFSGVVFLAGSFPAGAKIQRVKIGGGG